MRTLSQRSEECDAPGALWSVLDGHLQAHSGTSHTIPGHTQHILDGTPMLGLCSSPFQQGVQSLLDKVFKSFSKTCLSPSRHGAAIGLWVDSICFGCRQCVTL